MSGFVFRLCVGLLLYMGGATGNIWAQPVVWAQGSAAPADLNAADLGRTLEESVQAETASLARYREQLQRFQRDAVYFSAAVNGYQVQLSSYGNLLLATGVDLASIENAWTELRASTAELKKMIDERKTQHLFKRHSSLFSSEALPLLAGDVRRLTGLARKLVRPGFWMDGARDLWRQSGLMPLSLAIVFAVMLFVLNRGRKFLVQSEHHSRIERLGPWHALVLRLIDRSLILSGATLFLVFCADRDILVAYTSVFQLAAGLFWVTLATRWAKLAVAFWPEAYGLAPETAARLQRGIAAVRYFGWAHLLIHGAVGNSPGLLTLLRMAFEIWFLFWVFNWWRHTSRALLPESGPSLDRRRPTAYASAKTVGYLVGGAALLLDLVGYGPLALQWLFSWGRSAVVLLWGAGLFLLIREWDHSVREKHAIEKDERLHDEYPLQWLLIRFCQLILWASNRPDSGLGRPTGPLVSHVRGTRPSAANRQHALQPARDSVRGSGAAGHPGGGPALALGVSNQVPHPQRHGGGASGFDYHDYGLRDLGVRNPCRAACLMSCSPISATAR